LANTLTGRILTTTSPGAGTLVATSIQPRRGSCQRPAAPARTPITRRTYG
jgi:hypothetical protein